MIDCHCHILPGIDDGAKDMDMSLAMARKAISSGTTDIIATPHNLNGAFANNKTQIQNAVDELQRQFDQLKLPLKIHPGSECHLVPELIAQVEKDMVMTYANKGKALLVELPKQMIPIGTDSIFTNLILMGITPVIAHPERNTALRKNPRRLASWIETGCKVQLTAQSCSGEFGKELQKLCKTWCGQGWVHIVASDAHRPHGRSPDMTNGIKNLRNWLNKDALEIIIHENPANLLAGEPLRSIQPKQSRSLWRGLSFFREK